LRSIIESSEIFELPEQPCDRNSLLHKISLGGFPQIHELSSPDQINDWFASYVETYIQRDLRALSNVQNLASFSRFVSLVAGRTAQTVNYSELGKDIGVNYKTAQHYLSLLSASFLWRSVPPYFSTGSDKRLSKSPKGYLLDTGLAMFLVGLTKEGLERNPMQGALFESYIYSEISKLLQGLGERVSLLHFRAGESNEVDIVLEARGRVTPIEIKFSATIRPDWGRGIRAFRDVARGSASHKGYVLSLHPFVCNIAQNIINLPVQALLS
jgi:predicted AAA+ superfamily ATPase